MAHAGFREHSAGDREPRLQRDESTVHRIESTETRVQRREYRNYGREQSARSEQNARVYRDEGTESLQSRECSARGRDESTESRVQYRETRVQRVEGTVRKCSAKVQCESTVREYSAGDVLDREPRLHRDESTPRPLTLSRVERAPAHSDRCLQVGASGCPRRFARRLICGRIVVGFVCQVLTHCMQPRI